MNKYLIVICVKTTDNKCFVILPTKMEGDSFDFKIIERKSFIFTRQQFQYSQETLSKWNVLMTEDKTEATKMITKFKQCFRSFTTMRKWLTLLLKESNPEVGEIDVHNVFLGVA